MLTDDGKCTCEIKSRIAMANAAFNKKKNLFTSKLDLNLRKKLVNCYVWSMALYGSETWTLRATDQKRPENFETWCWRRMEKISCTDHVRNEEVLPRDNEQRNILHEIRKRKANCSLLCLYRARNKITQLSIPTHAQLQRHWLKFIKNHLKNSYMFRSSTIFREL